MLVIRVAWVTTNVLAGMWVGAIVFSGITTTTNKIKQLGKKVFGKSKKKEEDAGVDSGTK